MPDIPIKRAILERLLTMLTKSYERTPNREVKQAADLIQRVLQQPSQEERTTRITPTA